MSETHKALVVILFMAVMVFSFAKGPITEVAISTNDFKLRRNLWFGITVTAFLANNFWLLMAIAAVMVVYGARHDTNKIAFLLSLLFAVPLVSGVIGGFGIVDALFELSYFRLLSLIVLLPAYLSMRKMPDSIGFGKTLPDKLLFAFLLLGLVLQFPLSTLTSSLRLAFNLFVDVFLPYYVASRSLKDLKSFRDALSAFVLASMLIAAIGVFEILKGWLVYSALPGALGLVWDYGGYANRGANIRALASTGQPIVLGYLMAVALGFYLFVGRAISSKPMKVLGFLGLAAGLIAPLSRGPWVGAAVIFVFFVGTGPKPAKELAKFTLLGLVVFFVLLLTPFAPSIIDHLPFVGTLDADNVVYRERLLTNSLKLIGINPFFGSFDFLATPEMEELRWGGEGGIIDIVNSYLAITLSYGLVGLTLFVGFFACIAIGLYRAVRHAGTISDEYHLLGRVLLATLMGILVTIYTVASIVLIPIVYWIVAGFACAYIQLIEHAMDKRKVEGTSEHTNTQNPHYRLKPDPEKTVLLPL